MKLQHQISPLISRLRPRFGLTNRYDQTAVRSWEIAPSVELEALPGIYEQSDLEKITGVYPGNTFETELDRLPGRPVRHGATVAYEFHDAVLANGHLFTAKAALAVGTGQPPWLARATPEIDAGVLASTRLGVRYFGHWLLDDLSLLLAAQKLGQAITVHSTFTPGQLQYLELLSLKSTVMTEGLFRRMTIIDDAGLNTYRRERYMRLREMAARKSKPAGRPGVMLLRGNSGSMRSLVNEEEVADLARKRGFLVLFPETASASELLDACTDAPIVLGVEGSQLTNGVMWMAERGAVVVLQPPQRFTSVVKNWCDMLGARYAFMIGDQRENDSFHVDCNALQRLLDRVQSAVG